MYDRQPRPCAETPSGAVFANCVGPRAGAPAIVTDDRVVTYAELAAATRAIVGGPLRLGARGAHVGVLAEDRSLVIVAALAILARGNVFVPLDPAHPAPYLASLAETACLDIVLVDDRLMGVAKEVLGDRVHAISVDGLFPASAAVGEGANEADSSLDDGLARPAYVYLTSGTSGRPKAILGRADSLLHFVRWEIGELGLDGSARVAQLTSPGHDPFLRDVFVPLVAGGTVCVPPSRHTMLSPFELGRWIEEAGVTTLHCTPTVFRNLCHGGISSRRFPALRHVLIAGEVLRGADLAEWLGTFGDRIRLLNLYGPTETTLAKLYYEISPPDIHHTIVPIGRPMDGASVRVMADATRECEIDEVGELWIETAFATLGYLGDETLNFPFGSVPTRARGEVVTYRTGDLVRRSADGSIMFVGRRDDQFKLRGERVDLGEVECEARRLIGLRDCAAGVRATSCSVGPETLVLYYVADGPLDTTAARRDLLARLPRAMVPDEWVRVEAIPVGINGKVDRSGLSQPDAAPVPTVTAASEGGNAGLRQSLLAMWREILRNEDIGSHDCFMDCGGDSLAIMLLVARLDEVHGYELSLWDIFDDLTVDKLADLMESGPAFTVSPGDTPPLPGANQDWG